MSERIAVAIEELENNRQIIPYEIGKCSKFIVCEIAGDKSIIEKEIYFNPLLGESSSASQLPEYLKQFKINVLITGEMGQQIIKKFLKHKIIVLSAPGLGFNQALALYLNKKSEMNKSYNYYKQIIEYL